MDKFKKQFSQPIIRASKRTEEIPELDLARLRKQMKLCEPEETAQKEISDKKIIIVLDDSAFPSKSAGLEELFSRMGVKKGSYVITYSAFLHSPKKHISDIFILYDSPIFSKNENRSWLFEALEESRKINAGSAFVIYINCSELSADIMNLVNSGVVNTVEYSGNRNDDQLVRHASGVHKIVCGR